MVSRWLLRPEANRSITRISYRFRRRQENLQQSIKDEHRRSRPSLESQGAMPWINPMSMQTEQPLLEDPISPVPLKATPGGACSALLAIAYRASSTIASRHQQSLCFGNPTRVLDTPGCILPCRGQLKRSTVDRRRRTFQTQHTEMLTKDKKNVVLVSFVIWSVSIH